MKALKYSKIDDIIFIDIETVRGEKSLVKDSNTYHAWDYKTRYENEGKSNIVSSLEKSYQDKAALYAEFGKIICISVGRLILKSDNTYEVVIKDYFSHDEKELLADFTSGLNKVCHAKPQSFLFGHAIKGFDMPYIFRRCIINGIIPNNLFDMSDIKPWEATAKDTMELWKNGAFYSASMLAISNAMGLPSPKNDISGSEVSDIYWGSEDGLDRVVRYCRRDVLTLINIYLKLMFKEPIILDEIYNIPEEVKAKEIKVVVKRTRGTTKKPAPKKRVKILPKVTKTIKTKI